METSQLPLFHQATHYRVETVRTKAELMPAKNNKSPLTYILEQQKYRTREDLRTLRQAIDNAENIVNYDRQDLHRIYRECYRDPNLSGQWESRKMKTKEKKFKVTLPGAKDSNPVLTGILESNWFMDWIDAALDSKLWGFNCIETGPLVDGAFQNYQVKDNMGKTKFFDPINILDRDNIKPELGIITSTPSMNTGISFFDPKYTENLMYIGKNHDFGILYSLVKYILFKDNCLANWSEWAEIFGMDKRVGYTDTDGEDRKRFITAIKNLGTNAYGVFTKNDKVEFLGTNRTDAFQVYKEFVDYVDQQVAKRIWGQDVVTNNTGRVVGTTGENIADMYGSNDAKFIKFLVNTRLFPYMENLGFSWQGHVFDWDVSEKVMLIDRATIDSQIALMGFDIDPKYITETYGVPVTKKEIPEAGAMNPVQKAKAIKNLYADQLD